jgi:hypothetical protein
MWMYTNTDDSLQNRLWLDDGLGTWLDYWLFLHSDDTHSIWSSRPIGIKAIADAALLCKEKDIVLFDQLQLEIKSWLDLNEGLTILAPPNEPKYTGKVRVWSEKWELWLKAIQEIDQRTLDNEIVQKVAKSLGKRDFAKAFKWTRTLASELGSRNLSQRYLYRVAKNLLCDSGRYKEKKMDQDDLYIAITNTLLDQAEFSYQISIKSEDLHLTNTQLAKVNTLIQSGKLDAEVTLIVLYESGDEYKKNILKGFQIVINAAHPQQAFDGALDVVASISTLISHFRGHPQVKLSEPKKGDAVVINQQTLVTESKRLFFPRILWDVTTGSKRSELNTYPPKFSRFKLGLSDEEVNAWKKVLDRSRQVKDNWCNYPYRSAADIWQLLEMFSSSRGEKKPVVHIVNHLFDYLPKDALEFLAERISYQSNVIANLQGSRPTWDFWDSKRQPQIDKWVGCVLENPDSKSHFTKWSNPNFPIVAFDEREGLVQVMSRAKSNVDKGSEDKSLKLMKSRLESDLTLLCGAIRHKENHDAEKVFPDTIVRYLGRVGFEALFMIMNGEVKKGTQSYSVNKSIVN